MAKIGIKCENENENFSFYFIEGIGSWKPDVSIYNLPAPNRSSLVFVGNLQPSIYKDEISPYNKGDNL